MKFLGHVIGPEAISADPQRIVAILNYPAQEIKNNYDNFLALVDFIINL
jgi:hypothetical protein